MNIAGGYTVKPVKDFSLVLAADSSALILDPDDNVALAAGCADDNLGRPGRVLDSIVQQVKENVCQVKLIGRHQARPGLCIQCDFSVLALQRQGNVVDGLPDQIVDVQQFPFQADVFLIQPGHLQHTFHLSFKSL